MPVQGSIKWRRLRRRRRIDPGHSSKRGESILQNKESAYDWNQNHGHLLWSQDGPPAMQPHWPCSRLAPAMHGYPAGGPGPPHRRAATWDQPEQKQWEGTIETCCDDRMKQWGDGRLTNGTGSHFDPHIHETRTPQTIQSNIVAKLVPLTCTFHRETGITLLSAEETHMWVQPTHPNVKTAV